MDNVEWAEWAGNIKPGDVVQVGKHRTATVESTSGYGCLTKRYAHMQGGERVPFDKLKPVGGR